MEIKESYGHTKYSKSNNETLDFVLFYFQICSEVVLTHYQPFLVIHYFTFYLCYLMNSLLHDNFVLLKF